MTEAEGGSNHSSFDTATTASLVTTPGSSAPGAVLAGSLRPSTGAGEQDGGQRRERLGSLGSAASGPLVSPPLTSEPAAAGGAKEGAEGAASTGTGEAGQQSAAATGTQQGLPSEGGAAGGVRETGAGDAGRGTVALPMLQLPDEGTPAAEALAANAAIPHRGRGSLSRTGSMSMGRKSKSLRRLARNLQKKKKKKQRRNFQGNVIKVGG